MPLQSTVVDHRQRVHRVMMHINRNLDNECRLDHLAGLACFSPYHFIRIFETVMGETPQQYVARKRMERAGFYLLEKNQRIVDIALGVGYQTHNSFCKAFKTHFGVSPKRFRDSSSRQWFFKASRFYHPANGFRVRSKVHQLPTIKTLPPFKVVFTENRGISNGSFVKTAQMSFQRLMQNIVDHDMESAVSAYVSIYFDRVFGMEDERALSLTGAIVDRKVNSQGDFGYRGFPGGRYAIFEHNGPREFLMQTWNAIFMNWLPMSGETPRNAPTLEIYPRPVASNNGRSQACTYLLLPIH